MFNQLFRLVSFWRDFNRNQLIETYDQLFETYQLKNLIDLYRLRLNQISKQNSENKQSRGGFGVLGYHFHSSTEVSSRCLMKAGQHQVRRVRPRMASYPERVGPAGVPFEPASPAGSNDMPRTSTAFGEHPYIGPTL